MKRSTIYRILNFLFFYFGWGICLERASKGEPYIGPLVVAVLFLIHLLLNQNRFFEIVLIGTVAIAMTALDTIYSMSGLIHYKAGYAAFPHLAPLWVTSVWVLYGMSLNHSLEWLYNRWIIASGLGASTAILSYTAAERIGSLAFLQPTLTVEIILGVVWAVIFPLSLVYSRWLEDFLARRCPCKNS